MKISAARRVSIPVLLVVLAGSIASVAEAAIGAREGDHVFEAPEVLELWFGWIATGIEVAGIAVLTVGAIAATGLFARHVLAGQTVVHSYQQYRDNLGRAILLSLELLVAADIVGTVAVSPTFRSLGVLGLIVVIRTFLSVALGVEIHGHWPWRASEIALRRSQQTA